MASMSASSDEHAGPDAPGSPGAPDSPGEEAASPAGLDIDEAVSRVEHELGRLFARIRVSWREAAQTVHPDLQPLGYQVLTSIATGKATSAGAIIERLQTDKTAVSRQVRQLEQLGLVESVRDPDDRRARVLVATDLAQERVTAARSTYETRLAERLGRWSQADLDRFAEMLSELGGGASDRADGKPPAP